MNDTWYTWSYSCSAEVLSGKEMLAWQLYSAHSLTCCPWLSFCPTLHRNQVSGAAYTTVALAGEQLQIWAADPSHCCRYVEFQMHGYHPFKRVIAKCDWQRKAIPESPISKVNLATINPYKEVHDTQTYNTWNLAELVITGSINHSGQRDIFIALIHVF